MYDLDGKNSGLNINDCCCFITVIQSSLTYKLKLKSFLHLYLQWPTLLIALFWDKYIYGVSLDRRKIPFATFYQNSC